MIGKGKMRKLIGETKIQIVNERMRKGIIKGQIRRSDANTAEKE